MLTFGRDTFVHETERSMVNISLTLAVSIWRGRVKSARMNGSIQNLTDVQLFRAYRDLIARGGGEDAFTAFLEAEGEEPLARSVVALSVCQTASEFMGL
jgi:hypothetical protein